MRIMIVTSKKQYPLSSVSISFVTFLLCSLVVLAGGITLLGILFQLLANISPFLIASGITLLKFSGAALLISRIMLWLWRLVIQKIWISTFPYRHELVLCARTHLRTLLRWLILLLFR